MIRCSLVILSLVVLYSCAAPQRTSQTKSVLSDSTRTLRIAVDTNQPDLVKLQLTEVGSEWTKDKSRLGPWAGIYDLPLTDTVTALDVNLEATLKYDQARYSISPKSVSLPRKAQVLSQYFTVTDRLPAMIDDCGSLDPDSKRNVIEVLNAYEISMDSPQTLPSELAEEQAMLEKFLKNQQEQADGEFFKGLSELKKLVDFSANIGLPIYVPSRISILKQACDV